MGPSLRVLTATAVCLGEVLEVAVIAIADGSVPDAPSRRACDAHRFRYLSTSEGDFFKCDGMRVFFLAEGEMLPGEVAIGIGRKMRSQGAFGNGVLCRITLVAAA